MGSGRLLRSAKNLRTAGAPRYGAPELPRRGAVESRTAGLAATGRSWAGSSSPARRPPYYRHDVLAPFLAYHLKGKGKLDLPEALTVPHRHEPMGAKRRVAAEALVSTERRLYFRGRVASCLSMRPPGPIVNPPTVIFHDPANPVPYRPRPIRMLPSGWTNVAGGGSAFCRSSSGCSFLDQRNAEQRYRGVGQRRRAVFSRPLQAPIATGS